MLELGPPTAGGSQATSVWGTECKNRLRCRGRVLVWGILPLLKRMGKESHSLRVACVGGNNRSAESILRYLTGGSGRRTGDFWGENLSFSVKEGALTCTLPAPASTLPFQPGFAGCLLPNKYFNLPYASRDLNHAQQQMCPHF